MTQPENVFSTRQHCPVYMQSNNVAVRLYTGKETDVSEHSAILSDEN